MRSHTPLNRTVPRSTRCGASRSQQLVNARESRTEPGDTLRKNTSAASTSTGARDARGEGRGNATNSCCWTGVRRQHSARASTHPNAAVIGIKLNKKKKIPVYCKRNIVHKRRGLRRRSVLCSRTGLREVEKNIWKKEGKKKKKQGENPWMEPGFSPLGLSVSPQRGSPLGRLDCNESSPSKRDLFSCGAASPPLSTMSNSRQRQRRAEGDLLSLGGMGGVVAASAGAIVTNGRDGKKRKKEKPYRRRASKRDANGVQTDDDTSTLPPPDDWGGSFNTLPTHEQDAKAPSCHTYERGNVFL